MSLNNVRVREKNQKVDAWMNVDLTSAQNQLIEEVVEREDARRVQWGGDGHFILFLEDQGRVRVSVG